jgi:hypothetical protein
MAARIHGAKHQLCSSFLPPMSTDAMEPNPSSPSLPRAQGSAPSLLHVCGAFPAPPWRHSSPGSCSPTCSALGAAPLSISSPGGCRFALWLPPLSRSLPCLTTSRTRAPSLSCPPWLFPLRGKRGLPPSLDARCSGHGRLAPCLSTPRRLSLLQEQAPPCIFLAQEIPKCRRLGLPWLPASPLQPSSLTS